MMANAPVPDKQSAALRTPIAPGIIARVGRAIDAIRGADNAWFGPQEPLTPVADSPDDQTKGRIWEYPVGYNLRTAKRGGAPTTFEQLRGLADGYDLLRTVLETRKDQLAKIAWTICARDGEQKTPASLAAVAFWERPDKERDWDAWLRILIEEMYVTDAVTIYTRRTLGGDVYSFDLIDGATINRMIDATGRTPLAPEVAYQQILHGLPAVNYSADELLYRPRNPRVWKLYGFSPVEQIITTVNIALRRQANQLSYYIDGNSSSLIFGVPETWNPDQIAKMQAWWDDLTGKGRDYRARFIPGGVKPYDTKEAALKDDFDEWLARIVCFAFSVEPTPFVKMTNRATAETSREQSLQEGIEPVKRWVKARIDECLRIAGTPELTFEWVQENSIDPLVKAQISKIYLDCKVVTRDEVRKDIGRDPLSDEQKTELNTAPAIDPAQAAQVPDAANDTGPVIDAAAKADTPTAVKKKTSPHRLTSSLRY